MKDVQFVLDVQEDWQWTIGRLTPLVHSALSRELSVLLMYKTSPGTSASCSLWRVLAQTNDDHGEREAAGYFAARQDSVRHQSRYGNYDERLHAARSTHKLPVWPSLGKIVQMRNQPDTVTACGVQIRISRRTPANNVLQNLHA